MRAGIGGPIGKPARFGTGQPDPGQSSSLDAYTGPGKPTDCESLRVDADPGQLDGGHVKPLKSHSIFSSGALHERVPEGERRKFLGIVMKLMYLARLTRPDILLATTYLASRAHIITNSDLKSLGRIIGYLKEHPDEGVIVHCTSLQVVAGCDASFSVHPNGKGHTGYSIGLGASMSYLVCKSGKQSAGSTASTDCEIIALCECAKTCYWLREIIKELKVSKLEQIIILQDNQSSIALHQEDGKSKNSKHMLSKMFYVIELIKTGALRLEWLETHRLAADLLTKPLVGHPFRLHRKAIMGENHEGKTPDLSVESGIPVQRKRKRQDDRI